MNPLEHDLGIDHVRLLAGLVSVAFGQRKFVASVIGAQLGSD